MALTRPTLTEIRSMVMADIESNLDQTVPLLRKAVIRVLGYAFAGLAHSLYGYIDALSLELFPTTCGTVWLDRWADVWGITRKAAAYATGTVKFTGTVGVSIASGTTLVSSTEVDFVTDAAVVIGSDGTITATVTADDDYSGTQGNIASGETLTIVNSISGVDSDVTSELISGGTDEESDDDLRTRVLDRIQNAPSGGNVADYKAWALEVSGVTRAWVTDAYQGPGTVGITFVCDDLTDIIPTTTMIATVKAYIETVRPIGAITYVYAPTQDTINFEIYISPATTAVETAVTTELTALLEEKGYPGSTIYISDIQAAIAAASGVDHFTLKSPTDDIAMGTGYVATMGTITWDS